MAGRWGGGRKESFGAWGCTTTPLLAWTPLWLDIPCDCYHTWYGIPSDFVPVAAMRRIGMHSGYYRADLVELVDLDGQPLPSGPCWRTIGGDTDTRSNAGGSAPEEERQAEPELAAILSRCVRPVHAACGVEGNVAEIEVSFLEFCALADEVAFMALGLALLFSVADETCCLKVRTPAGAVRSMRRALIVAIGRDLATAIRGANERREFAVRVVSVRINRPSDSSTSAGRAAANVVGFDFSVELLAVQDEQDVKVWKTLRQLTDFGAALCRVCCAWAGSAASHVLDNISPKTDAPELERRIQAFIDGVRALHDGEADALLLSFAGLCRPRAHALSLRERIAAFYSKHNPAKVLEADLIAANFAGQEDELDRRLKKLYDDTLIRSSSIDLEKPVSICPLATAFQLRDAWGRRFDGGARAGARAGMFQCVDEEAGACRWAIYSGEFDGGTFEGYGVLESTGGERFFGQFVRGQADGDGVCEYATGERYSGEWKHGLRHGLGTCEYADGETYSGDWAHDRRDGFGVTSFKDGDRHYGQWRADDREGPGVMEWADGDVFCGAYSAGLQHGTAVTIVRSGDKFFETYNHGKEASSVSFLRAADSDAEYEPVCGAAMQAKMEAEARLRPVVVTRTHAETAKAKAGLARALAENLPCSRGHSMRREVRMGGLIKPRCTVCDRKIDARLLHFRCACTTSCAECAHRGTHGS